MERSVRCKIGIREEELCRKKGRGVGGGREQPRKRSCSEKWESKGEDSDRRRASCSGRKEIRSKGKRATSDENLFRKKKKRKRRARERRASGGAKLFNKKGKESLYYTKGGEGKATRKRAAGGEKLFRKKGSGVRGKRAQSRKRSCSGRKKVARKAEESNGRRGVVQVERGKRVRRKRATVREVVLRKKDRGERAEIEQERKRSCSGRKRKDSEGEENDNGKGRARGGKWERRVRGKESNIARDVVREEK